MTSYPPKQGANPQDLKNVIVFSIVAIVFYWAWDTYVLAPKRDLAQKATTEIIQVAPPPTPLARDAALAHSPRVSIENARLKGSIALKGAVLDDLALTQYFEALDKKTPVVLLSPRGVDFDRAVSWGWLAQDEQMLVLPGPDTLWNADGKAPKLMPNTPLILTWDNGAGLIFTKKFTLDEDFVLTVTQEVINSSPAPVSLHPFARITQTGLPPGISDNWLQHEGPLGFIGENLIEKNYKDMTKGAPWTEIAQDGWLGITDKYWLTALVPPQGQDTGFAFRYTPNSVTYADGRDRGRYQADVTGPLLVVQPGQTATYATHAFVGAKEVKRLDAYAQSLPAPHLDLAVNFGWFWFLAKPFFYLLHGLYSLVGNFGVAIILLTLIVRGAAFPLTNISYRSFAHMKKVAPQIAELQKLYKGDRAMLQAEIMKVYEKEHVNPMAGFLPILIQIPIFFALYKVLFVTIEMRHTPFVGWLQDLSASDPSSLFNLFGLLPWDVPSLLQIGVLPLIMLAALLVQKNLNPPPQDAIQRDMQNWFPFVMVFMLAHFPAGLVLYWAVSSIFTVAQQIIIMRSMGVEIHLFRKSKAEEEIEAGLGSIGQEMSSSDKK